MERKGDWVQIYSGKQFWPLDPRAEEIDIMDIAHSLSMKCRFNCHCKQFYSVAEHSVRVLHLIQSWGSVDVITQLWALLHDAAEPYLCDFPRPLKRLLPKYKEMEENVLRVIGERFSLPYPMPEAIEYWVKKADNVMLATEKKFLMAPCEHDWHLVEKPAPCIFEPLNFERAKYWFLYEFSNLMSEKQACE